MTKFSTDHPLPPRHLELIGEIAVQWSFIEFLMLEAISEITEVDPTKGIFLTTNLGYQSRLSLLQVYGNSLKEKGMPEGAEFLKLLEALSQSYGIRNKYVHSHYLSNGIASDPTLSNVRLKGKLQIVEEAITVATLEADSDRLYEAGDRFLAFLQRFDLCIGPSRKTPT
ncbi:MAG: hypothetical protein IPK81_23790 [Rhodospirillales bacterium]|nr:MAG: hypothetical protein IPK81_23790 [Rhodospirillales bacterium]